MKVSETPCDPATDRATDSSRAREIVASLRAGDFTDVFDAFWELDALPIDEVRDALATWTGPLPDLDRLDVARRLSLGLPLRPLRLRTLSVATDADIFDLGPVAEAQLRLAGKSWDGADLAPEERLDGELEGSFAGTLERRVLADADAPGDLALFDVLLFAEDSGVVFAAGTANVVALIAYRKVEMRDRVTRVALEEAIAPPSAVSSVEASPPPPVVAAAEKTTKKKTVAKKTAKKTAAKKTSAKKTVKKKTVKKKTVAAKRATR